ncbi:P-loop containing nucleoside triphosphate hydrolase protein [Thelonectria olida]|uniref:P-loop containing nucleoside triphosphate hydrolase protein n=1 Tax=Thelonectria olida TaxID=1576542 RepID=A0A9P9AN42_9HYPO|nr:P-loop containing nucleoside triphosphate hydrolase protein [Thelonectria olida]
MSGANFHGNVDDSNIINGFNLSDNSNATFNFNQYKHAGRPDSPPNPLSTIIPFGRNAKFVPRGNILETIHQLCSKPGGRAALVGLGGVGKSQLAIEFAYQLRDQTKVQGDPSWVFWVHAGTIPRVEKAFKEIANAMKIAGRDQPDVDIMDLVCRTLSDETKGRWCMIVDSADDVDVFFGERIEGHPLHTYLPQSRNGSILVTTRNRKLASGLVDDPEATISVGEMTESEALRLLEGKIGSKVPQPETDAAMELIKLLDLIPLAISQAGSYIQQRGPRMSITEYLHQFRRSEDDRCRLLEEGSTDLRREGGASNSVLTTWQISFDHIRSRRPSAADLLSLMSFFDCQGIPELVLRPHAQSRVEDQSQSNNQPRSKKHKWVRLADRFSRFRLKKREIDKSDDIETRSISDETLGHEFEADILILRQFCFIVTNTEENTFGMHGLVQLSTRWWLKAQNEIPRFQSVYINRMSTAFPAGDLYEHWGTCRVLFPHLEAGIGLEVPVKELQKKWAGVLLSGGRYADSQGHYTKAEKMVGNAMLIYETVCGGEHDDRLECISWVGTILLKKGDYKKTEELFVQLLDTRRKILGDDNYKTLEVMQELGWVFQKQGRWKEAQELFEKVLERCKEMRGVDHLDTLVVMENLCRVLSKQGWWQDAEELQIQVLDGRKKALGEEHPETLTAAGELASILTLQGRWDESEELETKVLEISRRILGKEHPDTLDSMDNLANVYLKQKRWKEAETLLVQVVETSKRTHGTEHPDTLASMNNLAHVWKGMGRLDDAISLLEECASLSQQKLGPDHPDTRISLRHLNRWRKKAHARDGQESHQ